MIVQATPMECVLFPHGTIYSTSYSPGMMANQEGDADDPVASMTVNSRPPPSNEEDSGHGGTLSGTTGAIGQTSASGSSIGTTGAIGQTSGSGSSIGEPTIPTESGHEEAQKPKPKKKDIRIGEDSLNTAVAAIRHHHDLKKQPNAPPQVPGAARVTPNESDTDAARVTPNESDTDAAISTPSDADTPHEYDLVLDGYMSVVLVIEAAAKCLYLRCNIAAKLPMEEYCKYFLERLNHGVKISEKEIQHVAKKLIGICNALSHANAQYDYLPHDPASLVPMFILYEQIHEKRDSTKDAGPDEVHYREVQRYTMRQFAHLCATMREVFLSWDRIDPNQEPGIGMREVQMAVMARDTDEKKPEEERTD